MDKKIFGRNLKTICEFKKIIQEDLARSTGLTKGFISEILHGKKDVSVKTLKLIANTLGLDSDDITKLYNPKINPIDLISKKPPSIFIPVIFKFSDLTPSIVEELSAGEISRNHLPTMKFISFPVWEPFNVMVGRKIIAIIIDAQIGMCPIISLTDIVFIDLLDRSTKEGQIYLCKIKNSLKLRYAMEDDYRGKGSHIIRTWAEERKYSIDRIAFDDPLKSPILGKVTTITHRLGI